jgi:hypothetical protein
MFVPSIHLTQRDLRFVPASARIRMAFAPSSANAASPPPGSFPASKRKPTPKPATARFTPQQAEDSPANQISMRFDPGPTPKYSCSTILKLPTLHPRKPSSRLANLRIWIRSQSHIPTATEQPSNLKTNPKTSDGQVHPTASRRLFRQPNINANRLWIYPKVLLPSHFETAPAQFPLWDFPANCPVRSQVPA